METEGNIAILLIHDDVDEANRLVSLLRNAGYHIDPHYAAHSAELNKKLQERNWDLLLAQFTAQSVQARNVIHQVTRLNKDIPVIFTLGEFSVTDMVDALRMGAADAVPEDEDQYFIQAILRALYNLEQRRKLRYWKRRFSESEDRFESLILSSQDAIAIIKEGTYVLTNDAYANFFGFVDCDSMMLLPVFDTIAPNSQNDFRKYLRPLVESDAWDSENIHFDSIRPNGDTVPVEATLSQIDFHGESALQLLIKRNFIAAGESPALAPHGNPIQDQDIRKIRLHAMVEGINSTLRRAAKNGEDALLFYIQVDQYEQLQSQLGIGKTEEGIAQLAAFLDENIHEKLVFGRIREEAFTLILASSDAEKGLVLANTLKNQVSSQIFTTEDGSFTCTLSIALIAIGETTASADEALSACQKVIAELQQPNPSGRIGNAVKLHEPVFDLNTGAPTDSELIRIGKQLLKKELFSVVFQPMVSLHGLQEEPYEVLMRADPSVFVEKNIAQDFSSRIFKTEIGADLDKLVIAKALGKLAEKKHTAAHTKLFLHLCQATIEDEKFIPWLQKTLETSYVEASDLIFIMREIDISRNIAKAANMLERLHNIGAATGVTHFGVSINPMSIFNRISVDYVKVDNVLSDKAQKDKNALLALKPLLQDLKANQCTVIVPAIETAGIIPTLWQSGVDFLQGYYIQAPMPEMDFDFSQE